MLWRWRGTTGLSLVPRACAAGTELAVAEKAGRKGYAEMRMLVAAAALGIAAACSGGRASVDDANATPGSGGERIATLGGRPPRTAASAGMLAESRSTGTVAQGAPASGSGGISIAGASMQGSMTAGTGSATARAGASSPGSSTAGVGAPTAVGAQAGASVDLAAAAAGVGSAAGTGGTATSQTSGGPLTLSAVDVEELGDGFVAFPETARPPMNQSPGFRWSGVPPEAKSLALVFRDVSSPIPPVKWVLWNMPPERRDVPANISASAAMPAMVAGASQLGSLGNQGYAGPCCVGNEYEWIIYALDIAELPGTERLSTAQINTNVIPTHTIEKSQPVMMRIAD